MKQVEPVRPGARARYVLRAWVLAVVPSLVYFFTLVAIGVESLRPRAGTLDWAVAGYSILVAPLLESALMLAVAWVLRLLMPRHERTRIIVLTLSFALAHVYGGGWRQVVATLWPSLVYSVTLFTWLKSSARESYALTALVHSLYNLTFFAAGFLGALVAAP